MIYQTAYYQIHQQAVNKVKRAIKEFTQYVKENEPGTLLYIAWQKKENPTQFMHFFIFKDEAAQKIHGKSNAVKKFESMYSPELVSDGVNFIDYEQIATNHPQ